MKTAVLRKPGVVVGLAVVAVLVAAGLYWFQPWKLWADQTVREELPVTATPPSPGATAGTGTPKTLATGTFISHEHHTSGTVKIVELPDGSRTLRLEDLDTSNGPALRVWLTDQPVKAGKDGWHVFDDGAYVSLGELKGNKGDQNYPLPAGLDLDRYRSISIWCDRFDVSFGAAELSGKAG
ncbi:DM13 domain-containing protein [Streptomyces sp. NPDC059176]|uniref:DM13 domain-containing protein n=1 Tax=unclassified Streptomyces TaxID=2593676 RepID=UPI003686877E